MYRPRNPGGIPVKPGDWVKYGDRLAEVIHVGRTSCDPTIVEVTDAGGRVRSFAARPEELKEVLEEDETVLDVLSLSSRNTPALADSSFATAEVWLADPRIGDVFASRLGQELELLELREDGSIVVELTTEFGPPTGRKSRTIVYASLKKLQEAYELRNYPGYYLRALRSQRHETPSGSGGK